MKTERGFTVVEVVLIMVAVAVLAAVGFLVYQRRAQNSSRNSVVESAKKLNKEDPYFNMTETKQSSPEELEQANNSDPGLRKSGANSPCGEGLYEIINSSGETVGCTPGAE